MSEEKLKSSVRSNISVVGNQLVIVAIRAQNLPNRCRFDKQSPYVVARIQDQLQRTRVVPRGGQTPRFDQELWFSLDNVESTTVNLMIYHQQKKSSELVCQADIDFSKALRRSTQEGYDSWFPLQYKNRPAGRIFLEMTYYPSQNSVPVSVENISRNMRIHSVNQPEEPEQTKPEPTNKYAELVGKTPMSRYNEPLPDLSNLDTIEDDVSDLDISTGAVPPATPKTIGLKKTGKQGEQKGWFSRMIDNAYSLNKTLPSLFNTPSEEKPRSSTKKSGKDYFQRQLSSPKLVDEIPGQLFVDSSDDEDDDGDMIDNENMAQLKRRNMDIMQNMDNNKAKKDPDEYEVGQKVMFEGSHRGRPRKVQPSSTNLSFDDGIEDDDLSDVDDDEDDGEGFYNDTERRISELRQSFKIKPLPKITGKQLKEGISPDAPPQPPRHLIPTDLESLFDRKSTNTENLAVHYPRQKRIASPRQKHKFANFMGRRISSGSSCKNESSMSYSEIRRMRFLGAMNST